MAEQIVGSERRERLSQLIWSGGGCFDSPPRQLNRWLLIGRKKKRQTVTIHVFFDRRNQYFRRHEAACIFGIPGAGILSFRGMRWAYVTFVLLGLLYFPASIGFRLNPQPCELIPNIPLAIYSLTNYAHIVLFVMFFLMTSAQFHMSQWSGYSWAALACIAMGILVEVAEGISGAGHCRLRDLIPDAAGVVLGSGIVFLWNRMRRRRQAT